MSALWLLARYRSDAFDVRVDDTDKTNLMELFEYMLEESVKHNVYLPKSFTMVVNKPRTNRRLELVDDGAMLKMWEWNEGKEEIESDEANLAKRLQEKADRFRREAEKEEAERQLREQEQFTVAVEVPVLDVEESRVNYVRIFNTPASDEIFPGASQPEPSQKELPPHKQPTPTPIEKTKEPTPTPTKKTPKRNKVTPRKKKNKSTQPPQQPSSPRDPTPPPTNPDQEQYQPPTPTPIHSPNNLIPNPPSTPVRHPKPPIPSPTREPTPPIPSPTREPTPSHQPSVQPREPTPSHQPSHPPRTDGIAIPTDGSGSSKGHTRIKPSEWRVPRSTTNKYGTFVGKKKGGSGAGSGRVVGTRNKKPVTVCESDESSDRMGSEDSEDEDYVASDTEDEVDMQLDHDDEFIVEEEDLADNIPAKTFEDYLDGSHSKKQFLEVFRDYCIQEGFAVSVDYADSQRYTTSCLINTCTWRIHASVLTDKVSWAIKKLEEEHTTCGRLEENPMVSSAWL
ncbi:uncharacterized protein LOC110710695 [Chenopodium quinoa]|uniref:uncharacterized protein LOC110710695 n=1 Tax=Chenopodium quinoa TaxID=63459 RepID=UPI000B7918B8|nr:uncharacterized protein LOC110710695 [Chenopodium quinoa]